MTYRSAIAIAGTTALGLLGLATMTGGEAQAQLLRPPRDEQAGIEEQARREYEPVGIALGTFIIHPSIRTGLLLDSNVFATQTDEERSAALNLSGRIAGTSLAPGRLLEFAAGVDQAFYTVSDNDRTGLFLNGSGLATVLKTDLAAFGFELSREDESRSSPDQGDIRALTTINTASANTSYRKNFSRLFLQSGLSASRQTFDNPDENQSFRDRFSVSGAFFGGYEISPRVDLYAALRLDRTVYDREDPDGIDRSSTTLFYGLGGDVDLTGLLVGFVDIGIVQRFNDDRQLDSRLGFASNLRLTYNLSPLTELDLSGAAKVEETTVTEGTNVASSRYVQEIGLALNHSLRPNLLIGTSIGYVHSDYLDTSRKDDEANLGARFLWLLNRNLVYDIGFDLMKRMSNEHENSFERAVFSTGITLTF